MEGLKGKVAIVTGGATLIGAAVVRAFQREGTKVAIADINDKDGKAVASSLGKDVQFVKTDLADDAQIAACVDQTVAKFGGVDFLINLACVYVDDALNATRKDWLESYNINVVGGVMMLKAVRPHMVKRGGGAVVNFGSISAKVAQTGRWLYPVTKAAMLQLTRNEAMDLAADKIRVNSVSPGWTWSRVMDELTHGDKRRPTAWGAPSISWAGSGSQKRWRKLCCFFAPATPPLSPARIWLWTAVIRPWARKWRHLRFPSSWSK